MFTPRGPTSFPCPFPVRSWKESCRKTASTLYPPVRHIDGNTRLRRRDRPDVGGQPQFEPERCKKHLDEHCPADGRRSGGISRYAEGGRDGPSLSPVLKAEGCRRSAEVSF